MKLTKKNEEKLELLATGDWPNVRRAGEKAPTDELQTLGLAEVYEGPGGGCPEQVRISEKGLSYLNGENVLSDRREKILENALKALRCVLSLHELTESGNAVPRDGEGAYLVELPPEAHEPVKKAAQDLADELKLIF